MDNRDTVGGLDIVPFGVAAKGIFFQTGSLGGLPTEIHQMDRGKNPPGTQDKKSHAKHEHPKSKHNGGTKTPY
jgi:hypothetical protein